MTSSPVGLSRDLPAKRVMRAQVGGQDLVVWRASNGEIAAWDNRCPHRGMALSHGFVRGNHLACLYHGWHYARSGQCTYIPAHPDLEPPPTIQTTQFGIAEVDGVIWVDLKGEAEGVPLTGLEPLRVITIGAAESAVWAACAATPFDGALPKGLGSGAYGLAGHEVRGLVNAGEGTCQVTLLSTARTPQDKRAVSRWIEAVRRRAEA